MKRRFRRAAAGQQYAIIVGLIAVIALAATASVGFNVKSLFLGVSNRLGNVDGSSSASAGSGGGASPATASGPLAGWGSNTAGALGYGSTGGNIATPVAAGTGFTSVSAVATGRDFSCVLNGGSVWCFGNNAMGQLGDNTKTNRSSAVQVVGAGGSGNLSGVSAIATGSGSACAIVSGGALWCWGRNDNGNLGDGTATQRSYPVQVVGESGVGTLGGIISVTIGALHTCGADSGGFVWCFGYNNDGEMADGGSTNRLTPYKAQGVGGSGFLTGISQISAGDTHNCALGGGNVWCWGWGGRGQLGNGGSSTVRTPVQVLGVSSGFLSGISAIASGGVHSCAMGGGSAYCWGYNDFGQVGDGTSAADRLRPVQVSGLTGVTAIGAGLYGSCAIAGGTVRCWGRSDFGQVGDGGTTSRTSPVAVLNIGGSGTLAAQFLSTGSESNHNLVVY